MTRRAPKVNRPPFATDHTQWVPYINGVIRLCRIRCPEQDRDDAVQEAILEIIEHLPRVDPSRSPNAQRAWLGFWAMRGAYRIAHQNRSVISGVQRPSEAYRKLTKDSQRAREKALFGRIHDDESRQFVAVRDLARDDTSFLAIDEADEIAGMRRIIDRALKTMRRLDVKVIRAMLDGRDSAEIAREIGCTRQWVNQIKHRAFGVLRRYIKRAVVANPSMCVNALDRVIPNWRDE